MTEAKKRKAGRPKGAKNRPKEPVVGPVRGRLRSRLEQYLTDAQIKGLSAETKARLLVALQPKEKPEIASTFNLVISGLAGPVVCPKCEHPFLVDSRTQQEAPGDTISPPAAPEAVLSGGPKVYVPDPDALRRLSENRDEQLPGDWYEVPDDFIPEREV